MDADAVLTEQQRQIRFRKVIERKNRRRQDRGNSENSGGNREPETRCHFLQAFVKWKFNFLRLFRTIRKFYKQLLKLKNGYYIRFSYMYFYFTAILAVLSFNFTCFKNICFRLKLLFSIFVFFCKQISPYFQRIWPYFILWFWPYFPSILSVFWTNLVHMFPSCVRITS